MRVGIVSIYPPPDSKHSSLGGVASYTHNLVSSMHNIKIEIIVLSNKFSKIDSNHVEDRVTIKRCWNKGIMYPFHIFFNMLSFKVDLIHIQHEFYLYGDGISGALFPLLLLLFKVLNKPVIVTMHGVIPLSKLNEDFIEENKLKGSPAILKAGLYWLVKLIMKLSTCTIVHEDKLKEILQNEYRCNPSKIYVIPHGIEDRDDSVDSSRAKRLLKCQDKKVILFFGYLTGYKGIELLIEAFNYLNDKDAILIIAGGEHPRLKNNELYKNYVEALKKKAADTGQNIVFTGFVPEDKIATYFSAADVVVCPYTVFISSSGPLSLCLAYRKPFLLSNELKSFNISDDLLFEKDPKILCEKIKQILSNQVIRSKSMDYCDVIKNSRSWDIVGKKTYNLYEDII